MGHVGGVIAATTPNGGAGNGIVALLMIVTVLALMRWQSVLWLAQLRCVADGVRALAAHCRWPALGR